MKIVHISVVRHFTPGQRKQLGFEHEAAQGIDQFDWKVMGFQCEPSPHPFIHQLPLVFRPLFLRSLYGWIVCLKMSRQVDYVLLRHMMFDPFVYGFAPFIKNRVSVHHAKEINEAKLVRPGWQGRAASFLERFTGRFGLRYTRAIMGVTTELAAYEQEVLGFTKPSTDFPNGIDSSQVDLLPDTRSPDSINVAFFCSNFEPWHGLDLLLDAVHTSAQAISEPGITIHLIGNMTSEQEREVESVKYKAVRFKRHGLLASNDYRRILATCDAGLGSLAMFRQDLHEGATLKNREMLAMGLAIYSGHVDTAMAPSFPYYAFTQQPALDSLIKFSLAMKKASREGVREAALPFIEKRSILHTAADFLKSLD